MKRLLILLLLTLYVNYTSAQSAKQLFGLFGIDISKFQNAKTKYTPGETFPDKGYNLRSITIGHSLDACSIERFPDVDSLFYMKVITPGMKNRTFYFMILNANDVEIILNNALNKENGSKAERQKWLNDFLTETQIDDVAKKNNPYWTFHKIRPATYKSKYFIESETVKGMGYQLLDSHTAQQEYNYQRGYDRYGRKISTTDQLATIMLLLRTMGYLDKGKYYCDGLEFDSYADMETYKNAQGLK